MRAVFGRTNVVCRVPRHLLTTFEVDGCIATLDLAEMALENEVRLSRYPRRVRRRAVVCAPGRDGREGKLNRLLNAVRAL